MTTLLIIYAIGVLSFGTALLYSMSGIPASEMNFRSARDILAIIGIILCWPLFLALFFYDQVMDGRDE